jgi:Periplasmic binding protein-like domain
MSSSASASSAAFGSPGQPIRSARSRLLGCLGRRSGNASGGRPSCRSRTPAYRACRRPIVHIDRRAAARRLRTCDVPSWTARRRARGGGLYPRGGRSGSIASARRDARHHCNRGREFSPPLTTIRIEHREMGRIAANMLTEKIKSGSIEIRHVVLRPKLVVRGSTALKAIDEGA